MKKSDLCQTRQKLLVKTPDYPGAFALVPPPTPRLLDLSGLGDELTRARTALDHLWSLSKALPNPDLITRTYDRREAVRSSQIEGTSSDLDDLFVYEATGNDEGMPHDVKVTQNYVVALEHGLAEVREHGVQAFSEQLIKSLHELLMGGTDYRGVAGDYRDRQNWIGQGGRGIYDARFVPPPHEYVPECMRDLIDLLRYSPGEGEQMVLSLVMRMAIAHAQFEMVHPFMDGNGRVGRLLLPLMLAAEGYPPVYLSGYMKNNQREYYDALAGVQLREKWVDWVRFFALGVEAAAQESAETALALKDILNQWERKISALGLRSHSVLHRFPELLVGCPVITTHQAKDALQISFPSASAALMQLEKMGIVSLRVHQKRNRTFVATEVTEVLNRPPRR